jgi:hypothetical protein
MEIQSTYALFARGSPRKEIEISPQVGDLNLGEDLNLLKICKGMLEMWKRRELQETM